MDEKQCVQNGKREKEPKTKNVNEKEFRLQANVIYASTFINIGTNKDDERKNKVKIKRNKKTRQRYKNEQHTLTPTDKPLNRN